MVISFIALKTKRSDCHVCATVASTLIASTFFFFFFFQSELISRRQSQIDRLYVSLKDLVEERKSRLEQQYWLYQLNREVDELEQWIAQREVVASSPELGQDFEHVTVSVSERWLSE